MQESQEYRDTVRQHVDLETIQTRLNDGSYASSAVSFHRDLLLLFTNAVVFFPPQSLLSLAAHQLRALVLDHIKKHPHKPDQSSDEPSSWPLPQPKPELESSDSLLDKQKSSAPLVVCRKRTRPSSAVAATRVDRDRTPAPVLETVTKTQDKPVTGARSSRRNNTRRGKSSVVGTPRPTSKDEKQKTTTTDKKKREASVASSDKKMSVVDFLKRIKNSPAADPAKKSEQRRSNNVSGSNGKETGKGSRRKQEVISPSKKNGGRPSRKAAGDQKSTAAGKRAREVTGKEGRQQLKRRARR